MVSAGGNALDVAIPEEPGANAELDELIGAPGGKAAADVLMGVPGGKAAADVSMGETGGNPAADGFAGTTATGACCAANGSLCFWAFISYAPSPTMAASPSTDASTTVLVMTGSSKLLHS
jgi:hypothetical protein